MKIEINNYIITFDYRKYINPDSNFIRYKTSEREIWYGNDTCLKIKYLFVTDHNEPGILELLFDPETEFNSLDWNNPKELLKINKHVNLKIKELSITEILDLIFKLSNNIWSKGFISGKKDFQKQLQFILGI